MDSHNQIESTSKKVDEKKLFSKIKKRDQEAFAKAYDLYVDDIYRFIYFKIGNQEEAQDLTSAVFLKTWNYILENSLKDFKTLRALIYRIARNAVIDHYRKTSGLSNVSIDNEENQIDIKDESRGILEDIEIKTDYAQIELKLKNIKEEYREVIILRYVNELSIAEISKVIDKSKGNIRVIISRALKALRNEMEDLSGK